MGAIFVVPLEGTVAGGKMARKGKKGGVDFDGRVIAKLAVVIIPTGSPVRTHLDNFSGYDNKHM